MNDQYPDLYTSYQWFVPSQFNIADACVHRWAAHPHEGRRVALYHEDELGQDDTWTYTRLSKTVNQLANGLIKMGVAPGDRVAIIMSQRGETAVACLAALSVGAIAMPLTSALGVRGLGACLRDARVRVAIIDASTAPDLLDAKKQCPLLSQIIGLDLEHDCVIPWRTLLARQPDTFKPLSTQAASPALLLYTVSADGTPKGVVLPHSALIGILPGFVAAQNWFPAKSDVFWSHSQWADAGGLMNALLPVLYFGRSIVATRGRFSARRAFEVMERYQVTNTFFTSAALRAMMVEVPAPRDDYRLMVRAIMMTDDCAVDPEPLFVWCRDALGMTPNEMYGRAEMNCLVGNSFQKWPAKPGSIGRPYPGHRVAVLDDHGVPCAAGTVGDIALNRYDIHGHPDPVLFTGYWDNDQATQAAFTGDWCLTGDRASVDVDGHYWYAGRREGRLASRSAGHAPSQPFILHPGQ